MTDANQPEVKCAFPGCGASFPSDGVLVAGLLECAASRTFVSDPGGLLMSRAAHRLVELRTEQTEDADTIGDLRQDLAQAQAVSGKIRSVLHEHKDCYIGGCGVLDDILAILDGAEK
jgi:hypothetical protein